MSTAGLNNDTISHLAELSKLEFNTSEKEKMLNELNTIIDAVKDIGEALKDKNDTKESYNPIYIENAFRDDEIKESISTERALKNAPDVEDNRFKVPKILED